MPAEFDLAPYGVPHKLKPTFNFNIIKQSDLRKGSRLENGAGDTMSFTLGDGAGTKYKVEETLGEGTYGIAYRCSAPDGKEYAIKFIKEKLGDKKEFITFLKECIVQILVVDASKSKANGPYAPRVYDICFNTAKNEGYLRSELMKNKLDNLIGAFTPEQNDVFVPDALKQIATMIKDLQGSLEFNHRDMKGDNIMYVRKADGSRLMRLIDFGMSCIKWHGLKISGSAWFDATHSCFKRERDLAQLLFYIQRYHATKLTPELLARLQLAIRATVGAGHKCRMHKLCPAHGLTGWESVYNFVDRANVQIPGGKPNFVKLNMQRFEDGEEFESPVASLAVSPESPPKPLPARDPPGICPAGEHKDPITGRCVKDVAPPLVGNVGLAPCGPGMIRNPVTGRCVKASTALGRHIASGAYLLPAAAAAKPAAAAAKPAAAAPKPCPDGKIRNPVTGRCIMAAAPCPPGQMRHPRTRRCVKVKAGGTRKNRY